MGQTLSQNVVMTVALSHSNTQKTYATNLVDTGCKLNVHKTFKRRPGRLLNVSCTFNLRPVPTGKHHNSKSSWVPFL